MAKADRTRSHKRPTYVNEVSVAVVVVEPHADGDDDVEAQLADHVAQHLVDGELRRVVQDGPPAEPYVRQQRFQRPCALAVAGVWTEKARVSESGRLEKEEIPRKGSIAQFKQRSA